MTAVILGLLTVREMVAVVVVRWVSSVLVNPASYGLDGVAGSKCLVDMTVDSGR